MDDDTINCANCGAAAKNRCSGCKAIKYCSVTCQRNNWAAHKISCAKNGVDLVVHRAGQLLQDLFFELREATYEHKIASVQQDRGALIIQDAPVELGKRTTFANHLMKNALQKKMALSALACEEPFAFFHDTFVDMLEGTKSRIDLLWVELKPAAKRVVVRNSEGTVCDSKLFFHMVARITSSNGFVWIVDVTGPQYGIVQTCWPEHIYMKQHVLQVGMIVNMEEHKVKYKSQAYPHTRVLWEATAKIESAVSAWESDTGLKLDLLLQQPDMPFQRNRQNLMKYAKRALDGLVADDGTSKKPGTVMRENSTTTKDPLPVIHLGSIFQGSPLEQYMKRFDEYSNSASVETAGYEQGACPDDEDFDYDDEDDEDDEFDNGDEEDEYYGEDSLDRTAEVRSCGRLHR